MTYLGDNIKKTPAMAGTTLGHEPRLELDYV